MAGTATAPPVRFDLRVAAAAASAAAAVLYAEVAAGLARQWYQDPDTAYGALVLAAAVIVARHRWPAFRSVAVRASGSGMAALVAAILLYIVATLAADVFLLRVSMVASGVATLWFVCGPDRVRALYPALVLCLVAIPLPSAVVTELTMPLQLAASRCAEVILSAGGVDVVRDGNVLTLSYITLEVAEACSGMRSMATLLSMVAVYWAMAPTATSRVWLLAAAAVPVAIAGNALRVVATALLASRMGEQAAAGRVHDATGFLAFVVMCGALAGVLLLVSNRRSPEVGAV
jgi:exosortase